MARTGTFRSLLMLLALMGLMLPACETFEDITGGDDDDSSSSQRPAGVARGAEEVESGTGDIAFTAPSRGGVYVVDATTGSTLVSRELARGQELAVDLREEEVQIDGRPILKRDLKSDHTHAIWFRAERGGAGGDDGDAAVDKDLPKELRNSRRIAGGSGDLAFTAPDHGRVFLYDSSTKKIVYRADMRSGERLRIDAARNEIELDGQGRSANAADNNKLYPNHQYVIYFDEK